MKRNPPRPQDDPVSHSQSIRAAADANPFASVPRPKMRFVTKGWNYREELLTEEQVEARSHS